MKAETYYDKSGKSWLVWWDKDGDSDYNTWTTNSMVSVPTHTYKLENQKVNLYVNFEIVLFPNGLYGFGYESNIFQEKVKVSSTKAYGNSFNTELEALQHVATLIMNFKLYSRFEKEAKQLLSNIEKDLIPKTLF